MIPSPWIALVLVLAAFRVTRFVGWDDFPPVVRARRWLTGERITSSGSINASMRLTNEEVTHAVEYKRPWLADLLACPYCNGFWVGLVFYLGWVFADRWALYAAAPAALSAAVGMIARHLDP